ncbi:MAG TPA: hypothetical protein VD835_01745 [Pyrinomonadaceae bacterium]|nr:hypothetical protein [Pyrinomonadaceae bacterium]
MLTVLLAIAAILFYYLPPYVADVWSLASDRPLATVLREELSGFQFPRFSVSWVTAPIAFAMLLAIIILLLTGGREKENTQPNQGVEDLNAEHAKEVKRLNDRIAELERDKADLESTIDKNIKAHEETQKALKRAQESAATHSLRANIRDGELSTLKTQLEIVLADKEELNAKLSQKDEQLDILRKELDRHTKPQIDITLEEKVHTHLGKQRREYYLIVQSPIAITGLRMEIEELTINGKTHYNIPLRETGDVPPYTRVFTLQPEEKKSFLIIAKEAAQITVYTAMPETIPETLPTNRFIVVARADNSLPRRKRIYYWAGVNAQWGITFDDHLSLL